MCKVMDVPMDSWEEKRGGLTPAEAYRCCLFGEGIEVGVERGMDSEEAARLKRKGLAATSRLKPALPLKALPSRKKGFSKERVEAVLKRGGKLSRAELLRCRVRRFSDGVAIGRKGFVEGIFHRCREHFGPKRKNGARKLREDAGGLHALREMRVKAVGRVDGFS